MRVYQHVTEFSQPLEAVQAMSRRPGAFIRFSPAGMISVVDGDPDTNQVGAEFTLAVHPPLLPKLKFSQTQRVVHVDDTTAVMDQVKGQFTSYRHETHLEALPDGGTRMTDRVTYEAPAFAGDMVAQLERQFRFRMRQMKADLAAHAALAGTSRRVLVAGASGLIGTQLVALLANAGQRVVRLVRSKDYGYAIGEALEWDPARRYLPEGALEGVDAVVNLAGHSIGGRFTDANKQAILNSRLDSTHTLAEAIAHRSGTDLIQASAIGIYGARRPGEDLTEGSAVGEGFLADVVRQWEAASQAAAEAGARVALLRTGIVLGQAGGALPPQLPLFLLGLGGRLAPAEGVNSWIGIDDTVRAYAHAIATPSMQGPVNMVGPQPVTHKEFADVLGRVLKRPSWLPAPAFGPKLLLGTEGYDQLIDTDQKVSSAKLEASGFSFAEPTVEEALRHTLTR